MTIDFVNVSTLKASNRTFTAPITIASAHLRRCHHCVDGYGCESACCDQLHQLHRRDDAGIRKISETYKAMVEPFYAEGAVLGSIMLIATSRYCLYDSVAEIMASEYFKTAYGETESC